MTDQQYNDVNKKLTEIFEGLDQSCKKTSFLLITSNNGDTPEQADHTTMYAGTGSELLSSLVQAMLQDEELMAIVHSASSVVMDLLIDNNAISKNGSIKKGSLEKILKNNFI